MLYELGMEKFENVLEDPFIDSVLKSVTHVASQEKECLRPCVMSMVRNNDDQAELSIALIVCQSGDDVGLHLRSISREVIAKGADRIALIAETWVSDPQREHNNLKKWPTYLNQKYMSGQKFNEDELKEFEKYDPVLAQYQRTGTLAGTPGVQERLMITFASEAAEQVLLCEMNKTGQSIELGEWYSLVNGFSEGRIAGLFRQVRHERIHSVIDRYGWKKWTTVLENMGIVEREAKCSMIDLVDVIVEQRIHSGNEMTPQHYQDLMLICESGERLGTLPELELQKLARVKARVKSYYGEGH